MKKRLDEVKRRQRWQYYVSFGFSAVLAEAAVASNKSGVAPKILLDVLENGGGKGVILDRFKSYLTAEDPEGFVFSLANSAKDTGYYQAMVTDLAAANKVSIAVTTLYADQVEAGKGNSYIPQLISLLN